jgi:hypothetical protein
VADCDGAQDEPVEIFCAGIGGTAGEDPCGSRISEDKSWGSVKGLFR